MSTVTLTIGPKTYSVACADGQEAHIQTLGAMIAKKYAQLGSARAPLEAQNLLFAALFMADELADARKHLAEAPAPDTSRIDALHSDVARLEAELEMVRKAAAAAALPVTAAAPAPAPVARAPLADLFGEGASAGSGADAVAQRLEAIAASAEANAAALEAAATNA